ncbi:MAG: PAS domain S-box protein [Hyphomonas sp.]|uniref:two-component system sensor histidine kinase NtrB n=1 Tax=Hyphomonas sp. TaxID=87 RepID=UPI0035290445
MPEQTLSQRFRDDGTLVGLVAGFLDRALDSLSDERPLDDVALPLVRAIEAIPGAGRAAILSADRNGQPHIAAAPDFSEAERERLRAAVQPYLAAGRPASLLIEDELRGGDAPHATLRGFALTAPNEDPVAFIITVRTEAPDQKDDAFAYFMDQVSRLAGLVAEDLRLRAAYTAQRVTLEAIVGKAPDAIIRIDRTGTILDFIGAAPALFGYSEQEVLGKHVRMLMPEPHAHRHDAYVEAFLTTGRRKLPDFGRRVDARRKDGSLFPIEIAIAPVGSDADPSFLGIVRDVSRTVQREKSLDELRQALEYSNRRSLIGEMASSVAHELNQPLTAISNYLDSLLLHLDKTGHPADPFVLELIGKARQQSRLGSDIIRRMRLLNQQEPADAEPGDFHAAVEDAISFVRPALDADGIALTIRREGKDGSAAFDRVQLLQVLTNIISNARRALEDTPAPTITVVSSVTDEALKLSVADNGPGIPDGNKTRIFESFFTTDERGTGLGLAVVKRIARAHGGRISAHDAPEGGALFELVLPRNSVRSQESPTHD